MGTSAYNVSAGFSARNEAADGRAEVPLAAGYRGRTSLLLACTSRAGCLNQQTSTILHHHSAAPRKQIDEHGARRGRTMRDKDDTNWHRMGNHVARTRRGGGSMLREPSRLEKPRPSPTESSSTGRHVSKRANLSKRSIRLFYLQISLFTGSQGYPLGGTGPTPPAANQPPGSGSLLGGNWCSSTSR